MDPGQVVVIVVAVLVVAAVAVVALKGRFGGSVKMGDNEIKVRAGRESPPPRGVAEVTGSTAGRHVTARGSSSATVTDSQAKTGDVTAEAGEPPDPNP